MEDDAEVCFLLQLGVWCFGIHKFVKEMYRCEVEEDCFGLSTDRNYNNILGGYFWSEAVLVSMAR